MRRNGKCNDSHIKLNVAKQTFLLFSVLREFCSMYFDHIYSVLIPPRSIPHSLSTQLCVLPSITKHNYVYSVYLLRQTAVTWGWYTQQGPHPYRKLTLLPATSGNNSWAGVQCHAHLPFLHWTVVWPELAQVLWSCVSCLNCYEFTYTAPTISRKHCFFVVKHSYFYFCSAQL